MALKNKLSSSAEYKKILENYTYISITYGEDKENQIAWQRLYPSKGKSIPKIQIVSGDGEVLVDKTGGISAKELKENLKKSGRILTESQVELVTTDLEKAVKLQEEGATAESIALITKYMKSGSKAECIVQLEAFAKELIESAKKTFEEAEGNLASEEKGFQAAMDLLKIGRDFKKMPEVNVAIKKQLAKIRRKTANKKSFTQAAMARQGLTYLQKKRKPKAKAKFELMIKRYPNTPAAEFAKNQLAELK